MGSWVSLLGCVRKYQLSPKMSASFCIHIGKTKGSCSPHPACFWWCRSFGVVAILMNLYCHLQITMRNTFNSINRIYLMVFCHLEYIIILMLILLLIAVWVYLWALFNVYSFIYLKGRKRDKPSSQRDLPPIGSDAHSGWCWGLGTPSRLSRGWQGPKNCDLLPPKECISRELQLGVWLDLQLRLPDPGYRCLKQHLNYPAGAFWVCLKTSIARRMFVSTFFTNLCKQL